MCDEKTEATLTVIDKRSSSVEHAPNDENGITPNELLAMAVRRGADIEQLERLMDLQLRWEKNEARKSYMRAMAEFKKMCPVVNKDKRVSFKHPKGTTSYNHATLGNVIDKTMPLLAKCGLSADWETEQDNGSIRVTCVVTHVGGHSEKTSLIAPPENSGTKNTIQAIASAITYLKRQTYIARIGIATAEDISCDDDGRAAYQTGGNGDSKDDRVSRVERVFRRYGVLLEDLERELGPSDSWGDEHYDKLNGWSEWYRACGSQGAIDDLTKQLGLRVPGQNG